MDVVAQQAPDLPAWLRIITTTRPEQPILERVREFRPFELNADRPENRRDVRAYIDARLRGEAHPEMAVRLNELAAANFLYARMALDALEDGTLSRARPGRPFPRPHRILLEGDHQAIPRSGSIRDGFPADPTAPECGNGAGAIRLSGSESADSPRRRWRSPTGV